MHMKSFKLSLMGATLLALAACHPLTMDELKANAYYWQRADASEAIYQEGPKAQQMLHRDVARCVTELRELDRLTNLRFTIPADNNPDGNPPDPSTASGDLKQWGTPERDGYLMTELSDYPDFETCMQAKGWERMEHVPYDVAQRSRRTYIETLTGKPYKGDMPPRPTEYQTMTEEEMANAPAGQSALNH